VRMRELSVIIVLALGTIASSGYARSHKHLLILSGQSNMLGLRPHLTFTPIMEKAFGKQNVVVVSHAKGTQPILEWYKKWKPSQGHAAASTGGMYDLLMAKVKPAIAGQEFATVTFVWMQGERDARMGWGDVYGDSFEGILAQLSDDLGRKDINFVIGRLSDFGIEKMSYPDWNMIRKIQVDLAEKSTCGAWVNTDDLNTGPNWQGDMVTDDIHCSAEGYRELGRRFAEKAIGLINKQMRRSGNSPPS
jgi:hypothetical protein